jgi:hypothetical protein
LRRSGVDVIIISNHTYHTLRTTKIPQHIPASD